jgi:hypothetical protein
MYHEAQAVSIERVLQDQIDNREDTKREVSHLLHTHESEIATLKRQHVVIVLPSTFIHP